MIELNSLKYNPGFEELTVDLKIDDVKWADEDVNAENNIVMNFRTVEMKVNGEIVEDSMMIQDIEMDLMERNIIYEAIEDHIREKNNSHETV
jgi:hypothetical protein